MLTNLNEKYLLKFMSGVNTSLANEEVDICDVLKSFGVKIKFKNNNLIYDIIDSMEYAGFYHE